MRCFIHIVTDTEFIRDPDGEDFADRRVAERETALVACDLMAEELRKGNRLPHHWKVLLALPDDTILMSLPFSQLIPAPPGFTSRSATIQLRDPNEGNRLTDADLHIMQGRARIEAQKVRIAGMQERGYDTSDAEDFLSVLVSTLKNLTSHRNLILQALGQPTMRQG
jgi:hypothetical protein